MTFEYVIDDTIHYDGIVDMTGIIEATDMKSAIDTLSCNNVNRGWVRILVNEGITPSEWHYFELC